MAAVAVGVSRSSKHRSLFGRDSSRCLPANFPAVSPKGGACYRRWDRDFCRLNRLPELAAAMAAVAAGAKAVRFSKQRQASSDQKSLAPAAPCPECGPATCPIAPRTTAVPPPPSCSLAAMVLPLDREQRRLPPSRSPGRGRVSKRVPLSLADAACRDLRCRACAPAWQPCFQPNAPLNQALRPALLVTPWRQSALPPLGPKRAVAPVPATSPDSASLCPSLRARMGHLRHVQRLTG